MTFDFNRGDAVLFFREGAVGGKKDKKNQKNRDVRFSHGAGIIPFVLVHANRRMLFLSGCAIAGLLFLISCELQIKPCEFSGTIEPGRPHGIVTSGFGLSWDLFNHRIKKWSIRPDWNGNDYDDSEYALAVSLVGGPWSTGTYMEDIPRAEYSFFYVEGGSNCRLAQAAVPLTIESGESEAEKEIEILLEDLNLDTFPNHAVFLQGLSFDTDISQSSHYPSDYDPKDGYTSRGIGGGVDDVETTSEKIRFTTWVRMESGPADRDNMNRAIKHARIETTVYLLIVGYTEGAVTYKDHEYFLSYDPPTLLFQTVYDHGDSELRQFSITGDEGYETAFIALRSFNFKLFGSVENGDYMREISVQSKLLDYNKKTGKANIDLDGYASNASTFSFETMENDFSATVALVQLGSGAAYPGYFKHEFEAGSEVFSLVP